MKRKLDSSMLGVMRVEDLLRHYAIPSIIATTATSLYNITDSIFIGQGVGAIAISGLAITFPLINLMIAFGTLVGVGGATLLSIRMGQKDYEAGSLILGNLMIFGVIIGGLFSIFSLIFLTPILTFFGATPEMLPYAAEYMEVILIGCVISHLYYGLNSLLRSAGEPRKAMAATIITVLINVVLNAIFIFGLKMGIRGSAIATVISQLIVLIWQIHFFSNPKFHVHIKPRTFSIKWRIGFAMLSIGVSPFLMNAMACVVVLFINQGFVSYGGDLSVGAYGIVNRVAFIFVMVVIGLNLGMQPIAGFNFGAKKYDRVEQVLKITIKWATVVMVIGFLLAQLFSRGIASLFTTDEELISKASEGLRIVFIGFPLVGYQIVVSNFFQSIGMAKKSIFLSLCRQLFFLLPAVYFLPKFFGVRGVWMSMPISDFISVIVTTVMLYRFSIKFKALHLTEKRDVVEEVISSSDLE